MKKYFELFTPEEEPLAPRVRGRSQKRTFTHRTRNRSRSRSRSRNRIGHRNHRNHRTRNNRSSARNNLVKHHPTGYIPSISRTDISSVLRHIRKLVNIPIYIIYGHSYICTTAPPNPGKEQCLRGKEQFFTIPSTTYILNHGTVGDFGCLPHAISVYDRNKLDIRKFLITHSASDAVANESVFKYRFSFFSDLKRAVQWTKHRKDMIQYPNISYTLNEENKGTGELKPRNKNPYGVFKISHTQQYDINPSLAPGPHLRSGYPPTEKLWREEIAPEDLTNENSILPDGNVDKNAEGISRKDWFLSDIIKEVYEKEGIDEAIFINTGCLASSDNNDPTGQHMKDAERTLELANSLYVSARDTLTNKELIKHLKCVPRNRGLSSLASGWDPRDARECVESGLMRREDLKDLELIFSENDRTAL